VALWHERDISHSSVERIIAPDCTILTDFMIHRLTSVIRNMKVYEGKMLENLRKSRGLIFSESVLIRLVDRGLTREQAYVLVQRNAMEAWREGSDFKDKLLGDPEIVQYLSRDEVEAAFDTGHALRWVDAIFDRVFS